MLVTVFGIIMEDRLEQPSKTDLSILVIELGIVKSVKLEQP